MTTRIEKFASFKIFEAKMKELDYKDTKVDKKTNKVEEVTAFKKADIKRISKATKEFFDRYTELAMLYYDLTEKQKEMKKWKPELIAMHKQMFDESINDLITRVVEMEDAIGNKVKVMLIKASEGTDKIVMNWEKRVEILEKFCMTVKGGADAIDKAIKEATETTKTKGKEIALTVKKVDKAANTNPIEDAKKTTKKIKKTPSKVNEGFIQDVKNLLKDMVTKFKNLFRITNKDAKNLISQMKQI